MRLKKCGTNLESDVTIIFQALVLMKASLTRFVYFTAFMVVATYAFVTLQGPHGIRALMEKQRLIHTMEKQNSDTAKEIERMREHLERLSDDPAEQEFEIRERYKLVHPGEKVYITGDPGKSNPPAK
jgi:cell division protein FtsB